MTTTTISRQKYRRAVVHARTWRRTALDWEQRYHHACREAVRVSQALLTRAEAAETELAILRAVAAQTPKAVETAPGDSDACNLFD